MEMSGVLQALAHVEDILGWVTGPVTAPADFVGTLELAEGTLSPRSAEAVAPAGSSPGSWVTRLPAQGRRWASAIEEVARRHGLDPSLLAALVWTESSFRPDAVSPAGAIGLTQLMPQTAAGLGVDPRDPLENLEGGARYLATQIRRFGSVELGLAAYQAGPAAVAAVGGIPSATARAYVQRVLDRAAILGASLATVEEGWMLQRPTPDAHRAALTPEPAGGVLVPPEPPQGIPANGTPPDRGSVAPRRADRPVEGAGGPRAMWPTDPRGAAGAGPRTIHPWEPLASTRRDALWSRPARATEDAGLGVRSARASEVAGVEVRSAAASEVGHLGLASAASDRSPAPDVREAASRVVGIVERLRDATPPRRVAVELPDLGGLRLLVEVRGTTIHVRPLSGEPAWVDALLRDLGPGLAARGFDLAGSPGRDPREDPGSTPATHGRGPRVRRREGVRI